MTVYTLTHMADDPNFVFPTQETRVFRDPMVALIAARSTSGSYFTDEDGSELTEADAVCALTFGERVYYGPVMIQSAEIE